MFVAIFYGIQIIWERDAGVLTKLLVTPTPRSALIIGKAFAAGIRAMIQVVVVLVVSAILGVTLNAEPASRSLGAFVIVLMGSAFFACLSMTIAGVVLRRDRLMGIGQMITMPLFFASNALYPIAVMPGWLKALSLVNPLTYEVDALRGLLIDTPTHLAARLRRAGARRRGRHHDRLLARRPTRALRDGPCCAPGERAVYGDRGAVSAGCPDKRCQPLEQRRAGGQARGASEAAVADDLAPGQPDRDRVRRSLAVEEAGDDLAPVVHRARDERRRRPECVELARQRRDLGRIGEGVPSKEVARRP